MKLPQTLHVPAGQRTHRPEGAFGSRRLTEMMLYPRLPFVVAMVALVLAAPALWVGFQVDDYLHRAMLSRFHNSAVVEAIPDLPRSSCDLFSFRKGDLVGNRKWMAQGLLPWWSDERLRLAFWRPLSSVTHWLDYRLWPDVPVLMHVHSLIWFGVLVSAVGILYRRILGPSLAAGLATILYGLDDAHGFAVGWLANRNALVATSFGAVALIAHDNWRRPASRSVMVTPACAIELGLKPRPRETLAAVVGPTSFILALLAGEIGVGTAAYLVAYTLFVDRACWRSRVLALAPYGVIGALWSCAYTLGGYGVTGSAIYTDPAAQPGRFAFDLLQRLPILLLSQVGFPVADMSGQLSVSAGRLLWLVAALLGGGLIAAFAPLLRRDAQARFWASGMMLALVPACATIPQDRLLFFPGIGAMGLIGQYVVAARADASWRASRSPKAIRWVAGVLLFIHLIVAPILLPLRAYSPARMGRSFQRAADSLPLDPRLAEQRLIVVNAPHGYLASLLAPMRMLRGQPAPASVWLLAPSLASVAIERVDSQTLRIRPARGFLPEPGAPCLDCPPPPAISKTYIYEHWNRLFLDPAGHFHSGQIIDLGAMRITITIVSPDGLPLEALFHFDVPLEDPSLRWMQWLGGRLAPFDLPASGQKVTLRAATPS